MHRSLIVLSAALAAAGFACGAGGGGHPDPPPGGEAGGPSREAWIGDARVTLELDAPPVVGSNPVTVTVYRRSAEGLSPVDDAVIHLAPEMPSMGHGAPAGTDPTLSSAGHYRGTVHLTMAGDWVVTATLSEGGAALGSAEFPVSF